MPITNPWNGLSLAPSNEYVLDIDKPVLDNKPPKPKERIKDHLELNVWPEPFIGNVKTARLVVLLANPGFNKDDLKAQKISTFRKQYEKNTLKGGQEGGFYYFSSKQTLELSGGRWARDVHWQIIQAVAKKLGKSIGNQDNFVEHPDPEILEVLYRNIMHIDLFPYHSVNGHPAIRHHNVVPSQEYQLKLVQQAKDNEAYIVAVRPLVAWREALGTTFDSSFLVYGGQSVRLTKDALDGFNGLGTFQRILDSFD